MLLLCETIFAQAEGAQVAMDSTDGPGHAGTSYRARLHCPRCTSSLCPGANAPQNERGISNCQLNVSSLGHMGYLALWFVHKNRSGPPTAS